MPGGGAEYHCQHHIGRPGSYQQYPYGHVRIENAVDRGDRPTGEHPQSQHTPCHGAGHAEKYQRQPQQLPLSAEGRQGQQHTCCRFHRHPGEKFHARQKHRRCVSASQKRSQHIPAAPKGHSRQPPGGEQQQIVHQCVEHEYAVDVNDGHGIPPFPETDPEQPGPRSDRDDYTVPAA